MLTVKKKKTHQAFNGSITRTASVTLDQSQKDHRLIQAALNVCEWTMPGTCMLAPELEPAAGTISTETI